MNDIEGHLRSIIQIAKGKLLQLKSRVLELTFDSNVDQKKVYNDLLQEIESILATFVIH